MKTANGLNTFFSLLTLAWFEYNMSYFIKNGISLLIMYILFVFESCIMVAYASWKAVLLAVGV